MIETSQVYLYEFYYILSHFDINRISGVMVSVLTLSPVDCGFISGVMVSVLTLSPVDCGFEPRSEDYKIGICVLV